jgi:hypothetical protein
MVFMAFLLVESTIFEASESPLGSAGAEMSIEDGAGSMTGVAAVSTGGAMVAAVGPVGIGVG